MQKVQTNNIVLAVVALIVFIVLLRMYNTYLKSCDNNTIFIENLEMNETINNRETILEVKRDSSKRTLEKVIWFYADWCGHCKVFKPQWQQYVELMKGKEVVIQEVNGDEDRNAEVSLQEKYNIRGYPTVVFHFSDNTFEHYSGARTSDALLKKTNELLS